MMPFDEKLQVITQFFNLAETIDYIGEPVSQVQHALQCAYFAEKSHHSEEVILASLLHDIGHFASDTQQNTMADLGVVFHEWIGAKLAYDLNFSEKVALLIGYHVDAKRYLAGKNPRYFNLLSTASKKTLTHQGGLMDSEERSYFEKLPYFKEILQVRINDEKAKEVNLKVPNFSYYLPMIQSHIKAHHKLLKPYQIDAPLVNFIDGNWVEKFKKQLAQVHFLSSDINN